MSNQSKKGAAPPRYDTEFKLGAIQMVREQNRTIKDVANDLGICVDTLKYWLKTQTIHQMHMQAILIAQKNLNQKSAHSKR